jgi:hypothetical protein
LKGNAETVNHLREEFDKARNPDFESSDPNEAYTIADLVKLFLRELPEPILTYDLYDAFLRCPAGENYL